MKDNKELKKIAKQIVQFEVGYSEHGNDSEAAQQIESLAESLSLEELMFIDDYIMKNFDFLKNLCYNNNR